MVDVTQLWVGDTLKVMGSGKEGSFLGLASDGRVRLRRGEKTILVRPQNLELVPEKEHNEKLRLLKEKELNIKLNQTKVDPVIDLHIEKLNPNLINALPERIVDFQVKSFENFMEIAVKQNLKFLTIIHGKGTGTLRAHIRSFLGSMHEVSHHIVINNGGATEVVMK